MKDILDLDAHIECNRLLTWSLGHTKPCGDEAAVHMEFPAYIRYMANFVTTRLGKV